MGGDGADVLDGGGGNDTLRGGAGADVFVFGAGFASDRVADFAPGVDHLRIAIAQASFADLIMNDGPDGVEIALAGQGTIVLMGIEATVLTSDDFLF